MMKPGFYRTWAEVNLDYFSHNVSEIVRIKKKDTKIMAVVKADAYGHGVKETAGILIENGIDRLAVSTLDEALQLRHLGVAVPIQVLSFTPAERITEILDYDIIQTVFNPETAQNISELATRRGICATVHIKVDTGMGRLGFFPTEEDAEKIAKISKLPNLYVEGLMTHFASSDERDPAYTNYQFERFMDLYCQLEHIGVHIPIRHVANSSAICNYQEMHLEMVRPGLMLYGLYSLPNDEKRKVDLKPVMTLKSVIINIRHLQENSCISYGRTFKTSRESIIATIPIGYADGYPRQLSNKGRVLIGGEYAPVVGRICMDHTMVDVTDLKDDISIGDEVVLFGRQLDKKITADEIAEQIGTISYEVVSRIGLRVPRVYLRGGKVVSTQNYLI